MQYIRELKKYYWPKNAEDAVRMMIQEPDSQVIAGGTDLLVSGPPRKQVKNLIDITKCGLSYIKKDKKSIKIGSTTTMSEIQHNPALMDYANGILSKAAARFVSVQIRNVATIGGNLASSWPSSDLAPALMALDAKILAIGKEKKEFAIDSFFISRRQSALGALELITEIEIPQIPSKSGFSFVKFGRTEVDIALVNGAAMIELSDDKKVATIRLAMGSVAPTTVRCVEVEKELKGKNLTKEIIAAACENVSKSIDPKSDVRASAKYRGRLARVLAARLIEEAFLNAGGKF
ncbi:MAG TPA: FAD binding domain-containing protein [Candidatus Wallbacteria bacterium]|nr:FAD binding domain-containing protein [Candidatus Wallbacteria bacterium]